MNGTRSDTAEAAITTTVSALSDDRLLERTKELSGIEHHLEVVVIDHLREIDKRRAARARAAGAEQTSAASARGAASAAKQEAGSDSAAPSAAKVSAQPGDEAAAPLQIDHVVPYAQGGAAEPNNLRLLCAAHHRHRHAGAGFGRPGEDRQAPVPVSPAAEGGNR